jgi:hypothetical protein
MKKTRLSLRPLQWKEIAPIGFAAFSSWFSLYP